MLHGTWQSQRIMRWNCSLKECSLYLHVLKDRIPLCCVFSLIYHEHIIDYYLWFAYILWSFNKPMRMHSNSLVYVSALRTNVLGTYVCVFFKTGMCHNHKSTVLIIHVTAMLLLLQYSYNPDKKLIKLKSTAHQVLLIWVCMRDFVM